MVVVHPAPAPAGAEVSPVILSPSDELPRELEVRLRPFTGGTELAVRARVGAALVLSTDYRPATDWTLRVGVCASLLLGARYPYTAHAPLTATKFLQLRDVLAPLGLRGLKGQRT